MGLTIIIREKPWTIFFILAFLSFLITVTTDYDLLFYGLVFLILGAIMAAFDLTRRGEAY
jgi:hypothetical protein